MFQSEKGANAIPGYTGFIPSQDYNEDVLQIQGNRNHIPNYAGFVPGIKSENLMGKTYGKITLLSSTHEHHRGADLPPEIRYKSEIQEAYCDQRQQRSKDIELYSKLDKETSKALAYTLSNLTQAEKEELRNTRIDQKDRKSDLTFEEAQKLV